MNNKDTYKSVSGVSEGLYKELGSRFISFAIPVESQEEVKDRLNAIRKEYHDARHVCSAFRIGLEGKEWRASDDGEPSGTGGRPILAAIDSAGLSDVLIAVVRYFGGIKLGVPGLARAYREAAADALGKAETIEKVAGEWRRISFGWELMPEVMKMVKEMELPQRAQDFSESCTMEVRVRLNLMQDFLERTSKFVNFKNEMI